MLKYTVVALMASLFLTSCLTETGSMAGKNNVVFMRDCDEDHCDEDECDHGQCEKVVLCHVPPGNPLAAHTIEISESAVDAHLDNHEGDHLGECTCEDFGNCDTGESDADTDADSDCDTDTDTDSDGDTDTEPTGTTGDTGESDTDTDTDTDTDSDSDTDVEPTGDSSEEPISRSEVWVENGCNTGRTSDAGFMAIFGLLAFTLARRK